MRSQMYYACRTLLRVPFHGACLSMCLFLTHNGEPKEAIGRSVKLTNMRLTTTVKIKIACQREETIAPPLWFWVRHWSLLWAEGHKEHQGTRGPRSELRRTAQNQTRRKEVKLLSRLTPTVPLF